MSLQALLAELQKNYLASMPDKIAALQNLWSAKQLDLLETEYHKLKGTGRTYGLPEITQLGAALERLCEAAPQTLPEAVPISIRLLEKIRVQRVAGETPDLDGEPEFKIIVTMVAALPIEPEG